MNLKFFISHCENGLATARQMITGNRVPRLANVKVLSLERPSLNPRGMANFSSTKGVIAAKKTLVSSIIRFW